MSGWSSTWLKSEEKCLYGWHRWAHTAANYTSAAGTLPSLPFLTRIGRRMMKPPSKQWCVGFLVFFFLQHRKLQDDYPGPFPGWMMAVQLVLWRLWCNSITALAPGGGRRREKKKKNVIAATHSNLKLSCKVKFTAGDNARGRASTGPTWEHGQEIHMVCEPNEDERRSMCSRGCVQTEAWILSQHVL